MAQALAHDVSRPQPPAGWSGCSPEAARTLQRFYRLAYAYAKTSQRFLHHLTSAPTATQQQVWNSGPRTAGASPLAQRSALAVWFGPFSARGLAQVTRTFDGVVERFERGYPRDAGRAPVRFQCLAPSQAKCRSTVLANASVFGVVRVCPRLLQKPACEGAAVVLHELLHQKLGVDDQRSAVCARGAERRCYRGGALKLVSEGRTATAFRNNDNYVYFAKALHLSALGSRR